jgi:hypothetical protein
VVMARGEQEIRGGGGGGASERRRRPQAISEDRGEQFSRHARRRFVLRIGSPGRASYAQSERCWLPGKAAYA